MTFKLRDHVTVIQNYGTSRKFSHGYITRDQDNLNDNGIGRYRNIVGHYCIRCIYDPGIINQSRLIYVPPTHIKKFLPCTQREKWALLKLIEQGGQLTENRANSILNRTFTRLMNKGYIRLNGPPHSITTSWIINATVTPQQIENIWIQ